MNANGFSFSLLHRDEGCSARRGRLETPRGSIDTPAFMPVGTVGTIKGLFIDVVKQTGAQIILGNTYHLSIRPGEDVVRNLGGLHQFTGWDGPILTDSGGFQIYSLAHLIRINDSEAVFRSHVDGKMVHLSPEKALAIQEALGSDIAMVLDHVVKLPNKEAVIEAAVDRSILWAKRSLDAFKNSKQILFAIVQGGLNQSLRIRCAEELVALDFPGYAVGGLSVGEAPEEMYKVLDYTVPVLPPEKPRYLMGVGRPQDLLEGIRRGIDMFDCVMPTRNGRNGYAFTDQGPLRIKNQCYQRDPRPLEENCPCPACLRSRGYIRHLFMAHEMLGPLMMAIHNLTYYQRVMSGARAAILENRFEEYYREKMAAWAKSRDA